MVISEGKKNGNAEMFFWEMYDTLPTPSTYNHITY